MNDIRLQATGLIWIALAAILIFAAPPGEIVPLTFILGAAATISTIAIWDMAGKTMNRAYDEQAQADKHKRDDRTRRLIEKLDEDEIADLEDLLAARREDRLIDSER